MAEHSPSSNNERAPLLRPRGASPLQDHGENGGHEHERDTASDHDFSRLGDQFKTSRRRRWISLIVSAFLIVAFIVILILSGVLSRKRRGRPDINTSICMTPACVHAASEILYNLSPDYKSIDPCTNFDTLVCEGFNNRHDIPRDSSSYSTTTVMSENGRTILRHILESPYPSGSQHSSFSPQNLVKITASTDEDNFLKMQQAYDACTNETVLQSVGVVPLVSLINRVADSFPVSGDALDEPLEEQDYSALSGTIVLLEQLGVSSFEFLFTGADDKNPEAIIIQAYPGGLTLPSPEYYADDDTLSQFQTMLEQVFSALLPSNSSKESATQLAKSVIDLEAKIAAVTPPPEDQQDVTKYYNIVKVADAGKIGPAIGLDAVIASLAPSDYTVDTMLLTFPDFLGNVSDIVAKSSKATVQSYLIWQLINSYSSYVEAPEIEPVNRFSNLMAGKDPETKSERWKTCLSYVDNTVGWILSRFFVEAAFSDDAKKYGDQIVTDIKKQFISKLNGLDWMDEPVKKLAVNKVNNIDQKIGYPTTSPDITNPEALRDYYTDLIITDSHFNNSMSSNIWEVNRTWLQLGKPVDHGEWDMQADIINAYYSPVGNDIVFPAGIMQFPLFQVDLPSYVSYGAFASVAGHELSHAFDSLGRHFDEHGNYTDWWTNHTVEEFQKRADCFVEQYSSFTIEGNDGEPLHVNGQLTLGENIADSGGIAAAFAAWQQRQDASPDQSLPGLNYFTHSQLFYVFYSTFWCGKIRKAQAVERIYTDPHSPAFARILGTMANSRGFRESFDCPVKEPTCELW